MSYSPPAVTSAGLTIPSYQDILDYYIQNAQNIFGQSIYLGADSADYQLLSVVANTAYQACLGLQAAYNQRAPSTALGSGLDALVSLNGIQRLAATYSTAPGTATGTAGTVITNGLVQDNAGNTWSLPTTVVIGSGGTVGVTATCQTPGPVAAAIGAISSILTPISGWTSFTNTSAATLGSSVETDSALRARQAISTAQPSQTVLEGLQGALAALGGVTRFKVYENDTGSPDSNGLPAHSVTCVVDGTATEQAIAQTIWTYKGPGSLANGNITVDVTDQYGVVTPMSFDTPTYRLVDVVVSVTQLTGYTSSTAAAIRAAVSSFLNSLGIGQSVYPSGVWGAALSADPTPTTPTYAVTAVTIAMDSGGAALSSALTSGTAYTALPVGATTVDIPSGSSLTLTSGSDTQAVTTTADAPVGSASIPVSSFTANFSYPVGTAVTFTQGAGPIVLAYNEVAQGNAANVTVN
ncbi:MAG: baseplate J/gp47 family protein [Candidatus Saccharimonadales bacterium]